MTEATESADEEHGVRRVPPAGGHAVPIGELRPGPTPRRATDDEHVHRLAEIETPLPPILVHRSTMQVIDGRHRLRAAQLRGRDTIDVVFFEGSEAHAFIRAVEENISHGLPLCLAERKAAATRIMALQPELSDRMIAAHAGLAAKTVAMLRRCSSEEPQQSNTREGLDGRVRPLSATEGRRRAANAIAERPDASLREIAKTAGVSLGTAHDVRCRIRRGEDPVPPSRVRPAPAEPDTPAVAEAPCLRAETAAEVPDEETARSETQALLENLSKDPALRLNDPGRRMLRLLFSSSVIANWPELADSIPPHRAEAILKIARQCAKDWDELACSLERRTKSVL